MHKSDESKTYSYDTAQRFTNYVRGVIGSSRVFTQAYTLYALSNWSSFNNNGSTQTRTYDSTNAITALGARSVNYDVKGNQTCKIELFKEFESPITVKYVFRSIKSLKATNYTTSSRLNIKLI